MDEMQFLEKLADASRRVSADIGDIRPKVWAGIAAEETGTYPILSLADARWMLRIDVAAAAAIVAGAAILYHSLSALMADMTVNGGMYALYSHFQ